MAGSGSETLFKAVEYFCTQHINLAFLTGDLPRVYRQAGDVPLPPGHRVRDEHGGRRVPGQGGQGPPGPPRLQFRGRGQEPGQPRRHRHLCPATR